MFITFVTLNLSFFLLFDNGELNSQLKNIMCVLMLFAVLSAIHIDENAFQS